MSIRPSKPDPQALRDYVEEGARIAGILLVWSVIGAAVAWASTDLVMIGDLFTPLGLGGVFVLTGFLNAILYVCFRTIDYWTAR